MNSLSKREKTLIYIMICVLICFVIGFLLIIPAKKKYDKLEEKKGNTIIEKQTFGMKIADKDKWEKELTKAKEKNSELLSLFYSNMSNSEVDNIVTSYILKNSLKVQSLNIADYQEKKEETNSESTNEDTTSEEQSSVLRKVNVTIKVTGSNENITSLLLDFEENDKIILQSFNTHKAGNEYASEINIRINTII